MADWNPCTCKHGNTTHLLWIHFYQILDVHNPGRESANAPNIAEGGTQKAQRSPQKAERRISAFVPFVLFYVLFVILDGELFREFQLGFAELEASAADVALRVQGEDDEVVTTQESHHHYCAFE